jgi:tRNA (guanine-N7-)-methyltransferase
MRIDPPTEEAAAKYLSYWSGEKLRNDPQQFPSLTSQGLFGNDFPLEIDFGCGTGALACSRAKQFLQVNVLGIDKSQKPLFYAVQSANSAKLGNIKFIRGDFEVMLVLLRPQTVHTAFYLFPNPPQDYHKERANKRRRIFLQSVHNALVPQGRFFFASDSKLLFENMRSIAKSELQYKILDMEIADADISTRYRRVWEEQGRDVRSFVIEKIADT